MGIKPSFHNILIIKPGAIGDLLQLTPVLRALAMHYPGVHITLIVGSPNTAELFKYNPYVSRVLVFEHRGRHRSFSAMTGLWRTVRRTRYDLVIHFQRSNFRAWILASAALPARILIYHKDPSMHVVENYLRTLAPLGIHAEDRFLELFVGRDDEQFADNLFSSLGLKGHLVVALNPGASHPVNRWPSERFAMLADILAERFSVKIVVVGGREDEALAEEIVEKSSMEPIVLSGRTSLLQLGAVLKRCALLVSGDTGPLHMATAVGTKVVGLFGAADPARTGPVGLYHRVIQSGSVTCLPCRKRSCSNDHSMECMTTISAADVADAVAEIIGKRQAP